MNHYNHYSTPAPKGKAGKNELRALLVSLQAVSRIEAIVEDEQTRLLHSSAKESKL